MAEIIFPIGYLVGGGINNILLTLKPEELSYTTIIGAAIIGGNLGRNSKMPALLREYTDIDKRKINISFLIGSLGFYTLLFTPLIFI